MKVFNLCGFWSVLRVVGKMVVNRDSLDFSSCKALGLSN